MKTTHEIRRLINEGSADEQVAMAMWVVASLDEVLPWYAARRYTGHSIKQVEEGWLCVLRGVKGKRHEVCFLGAATLEILYLGVAHSIVNDLTTWNADKYTSMRSDKT